MSVCPHDHSDIKGTKHPNFTNFFRMMPVMVVQSSSGIVAVRTSGSVDDIMMGPMALATSVNHGLKVIDETVGVVR